MEELESSVLERALTQGDTPRSHKGVLWSGRGLIETRSWLSGLSQNALSRTTSTRAAAS